jgi:hypothetical protein
MARDRERPMQESWARAGTGLSYGLFLGRPGQRRPRVAGAENSSETSTRSIEAIRTSDSIVRFCRPPSILATYPTRTSSLSAIISCVQPRPRRSSATLRPTLSRTTATCGDTASAYGRGSGSNIHLRWSVLSGSDAVADQNRRQVKRFGALGVGSRRRSPRRSHVTREAFGVKDATGRKQ